MTPPSLFSACAPDFPVFPSQHSFSTSLLHRRDVWNKPGTQHIRGLCTATSSVRLSNQSFAGNLVNLCCDLAPDLRQIPSQICSHRLFSVCLAANMSRPRWWRFKSCLCHKSGDYAEVIRTNKITSWLSGRGNPPLPPRATIMEKNVFFSYYDTTLQLANQSQSPSLCWSERKWPSSPLMGHVHRRLPVV